MTFIAYLVRYADPSLEDEWLQGHLIHQDLVKLYEAHLRSSQHDNAKNNGNDNTNNNNLVPFPNAMIFEISNLQDVYGLSSAAAKAAIADSGLI